MSPRSSFCPPSNSSAPLNEQLLLGLRKEDDPQAIGFANQLSKPSLQKAMLTSNSDSHLMTIAPTGSGKGRSVIIPNLLNYAGPVVAIDPKAELFDVTAEARAKMGQRIYLIDPFRKRKHVAAARLNPFDLLTLQDALVESDAQMLASLLADGHDFASDAFWNDMANNLVAGMIAHLATGEPPEHRTLIHLRDRMLRGRLDYELAEMFDEGKFINPMARNAIETYLEIPSDRTRPSVLSTARSYVNMLNGPGIEEMFSHSTINLQDVVRGEPMTIYIVIPPSKLKSHRLLLRLIITTLLSAVMSREHIPAVRTLFMLDEAAQLGYLPALVQAQTLLRAYGLQVWSFWQNGSQLKKLYDEWETLISNSEVLQVFGNGHHPSVRQAADLIGVQPGDIRSLDRSEQYLSFFGNKPLRSRRFDYLTDEMFAGQFQPNPRFNKVDNRAKRKPSAGPAPTAGRDEEGRSDFRSDDDRNGPPSPPPKLPK
jgi:type IV secretion system protein VirD4